jgi:pyruvate dehydrogenase E1 component
MNAPATTIQAEAAQDRVALLHAFEKKLLWLSSWMIHNANHIRPNRDGLKVGGHQASCASCISILAALYFEIARPQDRIAVIRCIGCANWAARNPTQAG